MMTIAEFARLCGCSAQTLRYYDRIDLLRPARVDEWTGYRFYEKRQAVDFVKIKNLQLADFSIAEIRQLLNQTDQQVYEAFSRKIALCEERLEQIKQLQQSYLREKASMEKVVRGLMDFLLAQIDDPEELREFGLRPEDREEILSLIRTSLEENMLEELSDPDKVILQIDDEIYQGTEQVLDRIRSLKQEDLDAELFLRGKEEHKEPPEADQLEPVWQADGWQHVHEFIDRIPPLQDGEKYEFHFERAGQDKVSVSFPLLMLGVMLFKHGKAKSLQGCRVKDSRDGQNHFVLMKIK